MEFRLEMEFHTGFFIRYLLFIVNFAVQFLQRFDGFISVCLDICNTLGCRFGSGNGRHIWNLCFDGCFSQVAVIMDTFFSSWRVDNQVNLAVGDHIQNVWTAFVEFFSLFRQECLLL